MNPRAVNSQAWWEYWNTAGSDQVTGELIEMNRIRPAHRCWPVLDLDDPGCCFVSSGCGGIIRVTSSRHKGFDIVYGAHVYIDGGSCVESAHEVAGLINRQFNQNSFCWERDGPSSFRYKVTYQAKEFVPLEPRIWIDPELSWVPLCIARFIEDGLQCVRPRFHEAFHEAQDIVAKYPSQKRRTAEIRIPSAQALKFQEVQRQAINWFPLLPRRQHAEVHSDRAGGGG